MLHTLAPLDSTTRASFSVKIKQNRRSFRVKVDRKKLDISTHLNTENFGGLRSKSQITCTPHLGLKTCGHVGAKI